MFKRFFYMASGLAGFAVSIVLMIFFDEQLQSELSTGILMLAVAAVSSFLIFRSGCLDRKEDTFLGTFFVTFSIASLFVALSELAIFIEESSLNLAGVETIFAVVFSICIGLYCRRKFIKQMKNVAHATEAANYLNKKSVNIIKRSDIFVVYEKWWGGTLEETSTDINRGKF